MFFFVLVDIIISKKWKYAEVIDLLQIQLAVLPGEFEFFNITVSVLMEEKGLVIILFPNVLHVHCILITNYYIEIMMPMFFSNV